jgi:hypothetical protein
VGFPMCPEIPICPQESRRSPAAMCTMISSRFFGNATYWALMKFLRRVSQRIAATWHTPPWLALAQTLRIHRRSDTVLSNKAYRFALMK